jgi:hypothetical protein
MGALPASSMPRYGDGYGIVPKPPAEPKTTTRPAGWVGGTAYQTPPSGNAAEQFPQTAQNPPPDQYSQTYPQTNAAPQVPQSAQTPHGSAYPQTAPTGYPSTQPNAFTPPNSPTNSAVGQAGAFNPNPAPNGALNQSAALFPTPQLAQGTVILARVGSEAIFASEITPQIDRYLAEFKAKMSPEEFELQRELFESQREMLIKRSLKSFIESRLIYQDESGALNEAFSDIMGAAAEFFYQPVGNGRDQADWLIAEEVYLFPPGYLRSLSNPVAGGEPNHYSLRRFIGTVVDDGGVHYNLTIATHAFYLAVAGGTNSVSGINVPGVGMANIERMERVFYRACTLLLAPSARFSDARRATIQAATDLFGPGSGERTQVELAWNAVGVF